MSHSYKARRTIAKLRNTKAYKRLRHMPISSFEAGGQAYMRVPAIQAK